MGHALRKDETPFIDDESVNIEMIQGETIVSPRPAPKHAWASSQLSSFLGSSFNRGSRGGPGGWVLLVEPELHWGTEIVIPDVASWRMERLLRLPETAYFVTAPDWVCEVLSPGTEVTDRVKKLPLYAKHGVSHVWLVNPVLQTLEVYFLRNKKYVLFGAYRDEQTVQLPPFAEVTLELASLWPWTNETKPG